MKYSLMSRSTHHGFNSILQLLGPAQGYCMSHGLLVLCAKPKLLPSEMAQV